MARKFAQVHVDIWQDPDFLGLSADARWVFVAVFAQKITTYCGVMPYTPSRLAHVTGLPEKRVAAAVVELDRARFLVADLGTGELLVRTYIAHNGVLAQPQLRKAMERGYEDVLSERVRRSIVEALPFDYDGPRAGRLADDIAAWRHPAPHPDGQPADQGAPDPAPRPRVMDRESFPTTGVTPNPGSAQSLTTSHDDALAPEVVELARSGLSAASAALAAVGAGATSAEDVRNG